MSDKANPLAPVKSVPESTWKKLSEKKIYFGHQSVGFNIIKGLEDILKENPQIKFTLLLCYLPALKNYSGKVI